MPFERPTLPELIDQGATEIESRIPGVLVRIRRSLVGVINRVVQAAISTLYQYAENRFKQAWPDTCDVEYLPQHGARWNVPRNQPAAATGPLALVGTNGKLVPAGTQWQRADGVLYTSLAEVTIAAEVATVEVQAVGAGQAGNASVGVALTLSSPISGVNSSATASAALAGGADIEDAEDWRARILDRIRNPPQGGAEPDYKTWAKLVAGVTRVWVYPGEQGAGTVVVRFVRDDDASPIPDAGEVDDVQAMLDLKRPVTAIVYAVAPIDTPIDFSIRAVPDTTAVRNAIDAELRSMILRDAVPGGKLLISKIREAVSIAPGEDDHVVTVPAGDVVLTAGQMATMGTITWLPPV